MRVQTVLRVYGSRTVFSLSRGTRRHDGPSTSDQTTDGLPVSGGERNHAKVTGTESSSMIPMTGSQYLSQGLAATQSSRITVKH